MLPPALIPIIRHHGALSLIPDNLLLHNPFIGSLCKFVQDRIPVIYDSFFFNGCALRIISRIHLTVIFAVFHRLKGVIRQMRRGPLYIGGLVCSLYPILAIIDDCLSAGLPGVTLTHKVSRIYFIFLSLQILTHCDVAHRNLARRRKRNIVNRSEHATIGLILVHITDIVTVVLNSQRAPARLLLNLLNS